MEKISEIILDLVGQLEDLKLYSFADTTEKVVKEIIKADSAPVPSRQPQIQPEPIKQDLKEEEKPEVKPDFKKRKKGMQVGRDIIFDKK